MVETSLHKELRKKFLDKVEADVSLQKIYKQITAGDGNYIVAEEYAYQIGNALTEVFQENLSAGNLNNPDLMQRFAESVLRPLLEEETDLVSKAAVQVQKSLNERANIGLKALEAPKPTDRISGLVEKVAAAEKYDDVAWALDEPVKNMAQSVVSETMKTNVEMHGRAGLSPKIIRRAESKCCEWCSQLEGEYEYPTINRNVYRRHERCRCTVDYDPGNGKKYQNVWTKQWQTAEERAKIENRKSIGLIEEKRKYQSVRYNDDGTVVVTDDWKARGKATIPSHYAPNAVIETQTVYKNGTIQIDRSFYDSEGWLSYQIHSGAHNRPHTHSFGADNTEQFHKHLFERTENGIKRSGEPVSLSDEDKTANSDILRRGEND